MSADHGATPSTPADPGRESLAAGVSVQQARMREALTAVSHPDSCRCAAHSSVAQLDVDPGDRVCRDCGCTDSQACTTADGPCGWFEKFADGTGICTGCAWAEAGCAR